MVALPISACYQMQQQIEGFKEKFGVSQDIDQSIKNLDYYGTKRLVAQVGTQKSKLKLESVMNNQVKDDADEMIASKRKKRGANDKNLQSAAEMVKNDLTQAKADSLMTVKKRRALYS